MNELIDWACPVFPEMSDLVRIFRSPYPPLAFPPSALTPRSTANLKPKSASSADSAFYFCIFPTIILSSSCYLINANGANSPLCSHRRPRRLFSARFCPRRLPPACGAAKCRAGWPGLHLRQSRSVSQSGIGLRSFFQGNIDRSQRW